MKTSHLPGTSSNARSWTAGDLFQIIRSTPGTSRSRLVERTGLAASTITARVEQLAACDLLVQGENDRGGRSPRTVAMNGDYGWVAAVDIGARHVRLAYMNADGAILGTREVRTDRREVRDFVPWLAEAIETIRRDAPEVSGRPLLGVGLSVPAPIDTRTGFVTGSTRIPSWREVDLATPLSERLGSPVWLDNDATLMVLAEHRQHYPEIENMLFVKLGSGIGCGIVAGGEVYRGFGGGAGDIGHVSVRVPFARECLCGRSDCLEASVGGLALVNELSRRGTEIVDVGEFARLAQAGDPEATELARVAGNAIGEALAIIVNFFNPKLIAVGGELSTIERLYTSMLGTLYERALPINTHDLLIEHAQNGENAGVCGAGQLVLDHLFSSRAVDGLVAELG